MTPLSALALAYRQYVCGPGCPGDPAAEDIEAAEIMAKALADSGFEVVSIGINASEPGYGKSFKLLAEVRKAAANPDVELVVVDPKADVR